ncbi:Bromodomain-containing protein [Daedalea quercina L-15889]|uniref:Bromodomain-containing protein n=1 Tax=Daedalea quercina L-15889 TaxID=1314783 RepID=A0A165U4I2_9APHY|nr:Bromodomain-containing protein [Daedalea quercina L-15889]
MSASPSAGETPAIEAAIESEEPPATADMEVDEATDDQVTTEPAPKPDVEEAEALQDVPEAVLTSVDLSSPPKTAEKQTGVISDEADESQAIGLPVDNDVEAIEEPDLTRQPDEVQEEDVDMAIEHKTPRSAEAVTPKAAPEEEPVQTAEEVEDAAEAQTEQLEQQSPSPAESPETALADMIEDTAQAEQEEPAVTTPATDEAQRSECKRKATDLDESLSDSQRDKKRPREESEPVDDEDATSSAGPRRRIGRPPAVDNPVVSKRFQNMIGMLHSQISQHRYGNIFHNPIRKAEAPDYHDIVKRPMDLKTIKSRIKDGLISNSLEFQRDVYLMFANAMMYNRPGSDVYHMAEEMMQESEVHINTFRQTEGFHRM